MIIFPLLCGQTPKQDLNSKLGMDLKRAMLLKLARKDFHLEDSDRREKVNKNYKVSLRGLVFFPES